MKRVIYLSLLIALGVFFVGPQAYCISRVGNSFIGDSELGFKAEVPQQFLEIRELQNKALRMKVPLSPFDNLGFPNQARAEIDVYHLAKEYPSLPEVSRVETKAYFHSLGSRWKEVETSTPCALALSAENGEVITTAVVWGNKKGIVLVGARKKFVAEPIQKILMTLSSDRGDCSWK